jgi:hypothetical protein
MLKAVKAQRPFRKHAAMVRPSLVVKFLKAFDHWLEWGIGWVPYMTVAAKYYPTGRPDAMSGNPQRAGLRHSFDRMLLDFAEKILFGWTDRVTAEYFRITSETSH